MRTNLILKRSLAASKSVSIGRAPIVDQCLVFDCKASLFRPLEHMPYASNSEGSLFVWWRGRNHCFVDHAPAVDQ